MEQENFDQEYSENLLDEFYQYEPESPSDLDDTLDEEFLQYLLDEFGDDLPDGSDIDDIADMLRDF